MSGVASAVDLFTELTSLKKEADLHRKENARNESVFNDLETQLNDMKIKFQEINNQNKQISTEKERATNNLESSLSALEQARTRVSFLSIN
jgi:chromosome segregation ATPase